ncbi:MAG TPA: heavy metal-binding domain-containing protein, partial [Verrucomicrobiae bacterium]
LYTCPMHPEIVSNAPGLCPKCEMPLVPLQAPRATHSADVSTNAMPPATNSASATPAPAKQKYYCPMHPRQIFDAPGKCPECEMDLLPYEK